MKKQISVIILGISVLFCFVCLKALYAEPPNPQTPGTTPSEVAPVVATPKPIMAQTVPSDDTISLDFKDAEIGSVLRVLSMKSAVNIVAGPEVKGLITVRLDNVPWEKALDVILRTYDYVYERDGNVIRVTSRDKMKLDPVETRTFILNYSTAADIKSSIQDILTERGKVKVSERTNMLVVTDIPTNLYRIGEVIKKLDQQTTQAFIDSKVVRTEAGLAQDMGIKWNVEGGLSKGAARPTTFPFTQDDTGWPRSVRQFLPYNMGKDDISTGDLGGYINADPRSIPNPIPVITQPTFSYGALDFTSFTSLIKMLETHSNTKIVSNPRVVVLNNQTASINVGTEVPLPSYERNETTGSMEISGFKYRQTGVILKVKPHINSAQEILVDLSPEVSSEGTTFDLGGGVVAPRFSVTKASTQVLIESGQTIAIGGLLTDNTSATEAKVPYFGDVPIVGKLFRSKRQTAGDGNSKIETLFFVTVTAVDSQGQPVVKKVDQGNKARDDQAKPLANNAKTAPQGLPESAQNETTVKETPKIAG